MEVTEDYHHFHYTRREHLEKKLNKLIREHPLSGQIMLRPIHNDLHANVEAVRPQQTRRMSAMVLNMLNDMKGSYTALDAAKFLSDQEITDLSPHLFRQIPFLELSASAIKRRVL